MLKLDIKDKVERDIVVLTIPSREKQIGNLLRCLSVLDKKKYNIILVCNTEQNEEAEAFVKKIFDKYNEGELPYQVVYNSEKTLSSGRNKGLKQSIQNIARGTRLTFVVDDDIIVHKANILFDFLEQGLQYAAFVGYPTFEVSNLPKTKRLAQAGTIVDASLAKKDIPNKAFNFLEVEKPRRYTPFRGHKYENAYVLYGHVHGNLQLHFTRVLESLQKERAANGIFNPTRGWYGEYTELNYRLQRYGLMGGFLLRSPNKMEHMTKANEWGLLFHNDVNVHESPTRTMRRRNENMLRAYIYLAIESNTIPFDIPKKEFMERFLKLLNSDFRFLPREIQEFGKLLQLRYSGKNYLFGTKAMSNEKFEKQRTAVIGKILDEIYADKALKEALLKRKIEYETAPFKLAPFEKFTTKAFNEFLRHQNQHLKSFREEIYNYGA